MTAKGCVKLDVHADSREHAMTGQWQTCVDDESNGGPLHDLIIEWGTFCDGIEELHENFKA